MFVLLSDFNVMSSEFVVCSTLTSHQFAIEYKLLLNDVFLGVRLQALLMCLVKL